MLSLSFTGANVLYHSIPGGINMITESADYTIQDFRIKTRSLTNYSMSTHHFHDSYEIYYMNAGSRDYFISDTTYRVKQGDLVLIRPLDLHKTMDTGECHSRVLISFKPSFLPFKGFEKVLEQCFGVSKVITFNYPMHNTIEDMIHDILVESNTKSFSFEANLQIHLAKLLIDISKYLEQEHHPNNLEPAVNQKVYEVIHYLKANYTNPITLDGLADDFYISRYYLTRVFKKTTGFTIFEFIHSLRVVEAQKLLKTTSMKVIDIAEKVGFPNVSNFGKVFKSITNLSPLNYRKKHM